MDDSSISISNNTPPLFTASEDEFPFPPGVIARLQQHRHTLNERLFFDEMCSLANINSLNLFPPRDSQGLKDLLDEIQTSQWDALRRECLLYYLLKYWKDGREKIFAQNKLIPKGYTIVADAYFHLDDEDVSVAVRCLTDTRVTPDFVPKVIDAIALASPSLVVHFIRLVNPPLPEESLNVYVRSLCEVNILDAWAFSRSFPQDDTPTSKRRRFIGMIMNFCLIPAPRRDTLKQLLLFPFTPYEQNELHQYALHPVRDISEVSLALLQDLLIVRLIHHGSYAEAIHLDRAFIAEAAAAGRMGAENTSPVAKAAEARRETFQEILAVLPPVSRQLIEMETQEPLPAYVRPSATELAPAPDVDMASSWEQVERPSTPGPARPATPAARSATPKVTPGTPLSASPAFRTANPKTAVLRAFAVTNVSGARGGQSPTPTRQLPNGTPRSTTPFRPNAGPSTPARTGFSPAPSPFAKGAGLTTRTTHAPSPFGKASPAPANLPLNQSQQSRFLSSYTPPSSTPLQPSTSTIPAAASSLFRATQPLTPAAHTFKFASTATVPPVISTSVSQPLEDVSPDEIFNPSKRLPRTPFSSSKGAPRFSGTGIVTPTKRTREEDESDEDLWNPKSGPNIADEDITADTSMGNSEVEDMLELEHVIPSYTPGRSKRASQLVEQRPDTEDEEMEVEQEVQREVPGAFPQEQETPSASQSVAPDATSDVSTEMRQIPYDERPARSSWVSAIDETPVRFKKPVPSRTNKTKLTSTTTSNPRKSKTSTATEDSFAKPSFPSKTSTTTKPRSSRASARGSAPPTFDDSESESNTISAKLRRSTRMAPTSPPPSLSASVTQPKTKKLRASVDRETPPHSASSTTTKTTASDKTRRSTRSSAGPPTTKRSTRKNPALGDVEE